jgi:hypothetical protein
MQTSPLRIEWGVIKTCQPGQRSDQGAICSPLQHSVIQLITAGKQTINSAFFIGSLLVAAKRSKRVCGSEVNNKLLARGAPCFLFDIWACYDVFMRMLNLNPVFQNNFTWNQRNLFPLSIQQRA